MNNIMILRVHSMLNLYLDNRENALISCVRARDLDRYTSLLAIETRQMDVGDIHICCDAINIIIERKTVNDMLASVKDGRYKEQKMRLLSSGCSNITYIIEGDDILSTRNQRNQDLLSSIYMYSMYRDNINMVFTRNIEDTCTFILTLCAKIIDKPDKFSMKTSLTQESYIDCIKMKKCSNITPDNCFVMQLSQIPTISTTIAKYINEVYPNMREFIRVLEESQDKVKTLTQIDKVGKEKANKILQYLHFV